MKANEPEIQEKGDETKLLKFALSHISVKHNVASFVIKVNLQILYAL